MLKHGNLQTPNISSKIRMKKRFLMKTKLKRSFAIS